MEGTNEKHTIYPINNMLWELFKYPANIVFLQKYYLYKRKNPIYSEDRPFPIDVSNLVQDTMETIRPKTKLLNDYEEALKALEELENEVKPKIGKILVLM